MHGIGVAKVQVVNVNDTVDIVDLNAKVYLDGININTKKDKTNPTLHHSQPNENLPVPSNVPARK